MVELRAILSPIQFRRESIAINLNFRDTLRSKGILKTTHIVYIYKYINM